MSCRGLQEGNEEIMSTILKWLADECADKKHDGHDHEHLFAIASWSRRYVPLAEMSECSRVSFNVNIMLQLYSSISTKT